MTGDVGIRRRGLTALREVYQTGVTVRDVWGGSSLDCDGCAGDGPGQEGSEGGAGGCVQCREWASHATPTRGFGGGGGGGTLQQHGDRRNGAPDTLTGSAGHCPIRCGAGSH